MLKTLDILIGLSVVMLLTSLIVTVSDVRHERSQQPRPPPVARHRGPAGHIHPDWTARWPSASPPPCSRTR